LFSRGVRRVCFWRRHQLRGVCARFQSYEQKGALCVAAVALVHPASHRTASGWRNCFLSTSPAAFALMIKKLIIYWPKDLFLCVFPREAGSFNFTTLSRTSAGRCGGIIIIRAENSHYSPPRAHSLVYLHVCSIWVPYGSRALK
jgi:hypothetical protein